MEQRKKDIDELTSMICQLTGSYYAIVSLINYNELWLRSPDGVSLYSHNIDMTHESLAYKKDRDIFYSHSIGKLPEFIRSNSAATQAGFEYYAGVNLTGVDNAHVGTVSILRQDSSKLNRKKRKSLRLVGDMLSRQLMLNESNAALKKSKALLEENNEMLKNFAHLVSHDMKMPLANMIMTTDLISHKTKGKIEDEVKNYLQYLKDAAFSLNDYVDNILLHYESDQLINDEHDTFDMYDVLEKVEEMIGNRKDLELRYPENNMEITSSSSAVSQILLNLIGNSIKYNDKDAIHVEVHAQETDSHYEITVCDNGPGIPKDKQKEIFTLFNTLNTADRDGKKGHGIGLSTVKKLVKKLGGNIDIKSTVGENCNFTFTIAK